MKTKLKILIGVAALLLATISANAQTVTNASGGTTTTVNPIDQSGTLFGLFGGGSASTNGTMVSIYKGVGDALAFVQGNTNGFARITAEGGYLITKHQGNGGFMNLLIPVSGTNNILGAGFGVAYLNGNWYDATLNARLGSNIPLKIGGLDLSRILPLYAYVESGGGYNFGTRQAIAQAFTGASLHYILARTKAGNTIDFTAGYAIGTISDITGNVTAVGGSLTWTW